MDTKIFERIPTLAAYMDGADHVDVHSGEGAMSLRQFTAGFLSYRPGWMQVLWKVRVWLLKCLGQGEHNVPEEERMTAETLPVEAGEMATFFTVADSDGETFWMAVAEESHLGAALAVVVEDIEDNQGMKRFHIITVVKYNNLAGSIYFNVIRPFHHLVVAGGMRSVLAGKSAKS